MADERRHVAALDGVRALAILEIFVFHAFSTHHVYSQWSVVRLGYLAVDAFFVLSGFLITLRLIALSGRRELTPSRRWGHFLLRRTARIFPLYYVSLLLLLVFGARLGFGVLPGTWPWFFGYAVNVFIFLRSGWIGAGGHFWSLCVEEQFYLALPALILTRARRILGVFALAGAVAAFVLRAFVVLPPESGGFAFVLPILHLDAFGAGIAAALCSLQGNVCGVTSRVFKRTGAVAAGLFLALVLLGRNAPLAVAALPTLLSSAIGALVLGLWSGELRLGARILGAWPLAPLGRVSYGFYVVHFFVVYYLWHLRADWLPPIALLRGGIALAISVVLASLSWRLLERPILALAHRATPSR